MQALRVNLCGLDSDVIFILMLDCILIAGVPISAMTVLACAE